MFDITKKAVFYGGSRMAPEHRLWLSRKINPNIPFRPAVFILHNPSNAAEIKDDPTSKKGIKFATAWGASDLVYVNASTRIATDAKKISSGTFLNCPQSDWALEQAAKLATENDGFLIAAWGAPKGNAAIRAQLEDRFSYIRAMGLPLHYLRLTSNGWPEHPLYLPPDLTPIRWE